MENLILNNSENKQMKEKVYTVSLNDVSRTGTLEELVYSYQYALQFAREYESMDYGNPRINTKPDSIQSLVDNLNHINPSLRYTWSAQ